jgi:F0F1-type ATP synthase epsilon subunit
MILTVLASYCVERKTKSTRKKERKKERKKKRRERRKTRDAKKRWLKLYNKNFQNSLK